MYNDFKLETWLRKIEFTQIQWSQIKKISFVRAVIEWFVKIFVLKGLPYLMIC